MKILWISPFFLHPTNRGGQIRTLGTLKELHKRHEIHFCALNPAINTEGPLHSNEYCTRHFVITHDPISRNSFSIVPQVLRGIVSPEPLAVSRYHSRAFSQLIRNRIAADAYDVIVCDFLACAPNLPDMGNAVLFQHNVETTIWQRHTEQASSLLRRFFFAMQAKKMARYERDICRKARFVVTVSANDAERMRKDFGVERIGNVATGVDIDYLAPPVCAEPKGDLVFSGSMDWLPNVDAIEYFLRDIFPLIRKGRPGTTVTIAGRSPDKRVLRAAADMPGVTVTGSVPDIRPYLWGSKLSIIPLRIGGGTRLKVYESMAARVPIVSTTIGAEGLACTPGEDLLIADSAGAFAEQCLRLLADADERSAIADKAFRLVQENFAWTAVTADFEAMLQANRVPGGKETSPHAEPRTA